MVVADLNSRPKQISGSDGRSHKGVGHSLPSGVLYIHSFL